VNDRAKGFSPARDLVVDVTGLEFKGGDRRAGVLAVADYFGSRCEGHTMAANPFTFSRANALKGSVKSK
jgi:hypothetical protein